MKKVESEHKTLRNSKKVKKWGCGAKITFLSNNAQEELTKIIGDQITEAIALKTKSFLAWFLVVYSTPDVTHKYQLIICVLIITNDRSTAETSSCMRTSKLGNSNNTVGGDNQFFQFEKCLIR